MCGHRKEELDTGKQIYTGVYHCFNCITRRDTLKKEKGSTSLQKCDCATTCNEQQQQKPEASTRQTKVDFCSSPVSYFPGPFVTFVHVLCSPEGGVRYVVESTQRKRSKH